MTDPRSRRRFLNIIASLGGATAAARTAQGTQQERGNPPQGNPNNWTHLRRSHNNTAANTKISGPKETAYIEWEDSRGAGQSTIEGNKVLCTDNYGIYQTDAETGEDLGFRTVDAEVDPPFAIRDGVIYFKTWGAADVRAVDLSSGRLWKTEVPHEYDQLSGGVLVTDDYVQAGASTLLRETGEIIRTLPVVGSSLVHAYEDGVLYTAYNPYIGPPEVSADRSVLGAIDIETGEKLWELSGAPEIWSPDFGPLLLGNNLLIGRSDNKLVSVAKASGQIQWTYDCDMDYRDNGVYWGTQPLAAAEDAIYLGGASMMALSPSGDQYWKTKPIDKELYGYPVATSHTVYFASSDSRIYACNRYDGTQRWVLEDIPTWKGYDAPVADFRLKTNGSLMSAGHNHIYVSTDGNIVSIAEGGKLAELTDGSVFQDKLPFDGYGIVGGTVVVIGGLIKKYFSR